MSKKERLITTLENQRETLVHQMSSKEKQIDELRNESLSERGDLADKVEGIRAKHQEALDELTQRRIEFERDRALKE